MNPAIRDQERCQRIAELKARVKRLECELAIAVETLAHKQVNLWDSLGDHGLEVHFVVDKKTYVGRTPMDAVRAYLRARDEESKDV
ncbi:MAG: hypothetical protein AB7G11_02255 [Phycisphaerales bacterium]